MYKAKFEKEDKDKNELGQRLIRPVANKAKVKARGRSIIGSLIFVGVIILSLVAGTLLGGESRIAQAQTPPFATPTLPLPPTLSLSPFKTLLVGAGQPKLLIRPTDQKLTYLTSSRNYGVVAGSETGYTALLSTVTFEKLGPSSGSYDETGSLHVVWSERDGSGGDGDKEKLYYNVLTKDGKTAKTVSLDLPGQRLIKPKVAYSIPQKTLFLLYVERGDPTDSIWVTSSSDKGLNWAKPLALGLLVPTPPSTSPAKGVNTSTTELVIDANGQPHAFFVVPGRNPKVQLIHRMRLGQDWTPPVDVSQDAHTLIREISAQASASGTGSVWLSWLGGGKGEGINVARYTPENGKWQSWLELDKVQAEANTRKRVGAASGQQVELSSPTLALMGADPKSASVFVAWIEKPSVSGGNGNGNGAGEVAFTQTNDGGKSFRPANTLINFEQRGFSEVDGMSAVSNRGKLYLGLTVLTATANTNTAGSRGKDKAKEWTLGTFEIGGTSPGGDGEGTPTPTAPVVTGMPGGMTITPAGTQLVSTPTATATNTASPTPVTPSSTSTPLPPTPTQSLAPTAYPTQKQSSGPGAGAGSSSSGQQNGPQGNSAGAGQTTTNANATAIPELTPTATLPAIVATATAYAENQLEAAKTPIIVGVPTVRFIGQGPQVILPTPTSTPLPTATPLPTSTPLPSATATSAPTATVDPYAKPSPAPAYYYQQSGQGGGTGLFGILLSGVGLLILGKGALNLKNRMAAKDKGQGSAPKAKKVWASRLKEPKVKK